MTTRVIERKTTLLYVLIYSIVVIAVAWMSPLLGGSPEEPGIGFLLWATAPILVSILMRVITQDWSDLGLRPAVRKNMQWYVISALTYPFLTVLTLVTVVTFAFASISGFSLGEYLPIALMALPIFFIFATFEEVGWRGYLAPKLAPLGFNNFTSAALLAIVWTLWHVPFVQQLPWITSSDDLLTFLPRYYLVLFALAIIYGEIRSITGSFWPAVLMHAVSNAFGHPLEVDYVTVTAGQAYLGSVSTGLFTIVYTILLGIAINRWRSMKRWKRVP